MSIYNFAISKKFNNLRIDKALSLYCCVSRREIQKAIKHQKLLLNGKVVSTQSLRVKKDDIVNLFLEKKITPELTSANIFLDILYEDNDLIVLNKSSTMIVHPGNYSNQDTLVNALLYHTSSLSDKAGKDRPGIVHRLDRNTSGLMLVAKNNNSHQILATQISSRIVQRKYKALIWGIINPLQGIISLPMARSKLNRKRMTTVRAGGKVASTHYITLEIFRDGMFSLVECTLETGRTHQIRVHLSHIGHSIVGDQTYGNNKRKVLACPYPLREELINFNHQALHSFYISFIHPTTKGFMEFEKDLPNDYNCLVTYLKIG